MIPEIEAEFAGVADAGYLNAASLGPMPERARAAVERFGRLRFQVHEMKDEHFVAPPRAARAACARLIGADPGEIALGPNTSFGINLAAQGLPVEPGSVVILPDREFPANVYPWASRDGLVPERVPVNANGWPDIPRLLDRLRDPRVAILAISSVQFENGYRADLDLLGRACRDSNTFFVVDAIQSLGVLPIDVRRTPVDVLSAGGHKWLCGPFGSGFVYVRREIQERLRPVDIGWFSMTASQDVTSVCDYEWEFLPDARRYEVGTPALQDHAGLAASVELLVDVGIDRIAEHVDRLLDPLRAWTPSSGPIRSISPSSPGERSGIFAIATPDPAATYRAVRRAGIICSLREGAVRIAPHIYNNEAEIARVIEVLEDEVRGS